MSHPETPSIPPPWTPPGPPPASMGTAPSGGTPGHAALASQRTVVEVMARRGGFAQAVLLLAALFLVGLVFALGLGLGAFSVLAAPTKQTLVIEELERSGGDARVAVLGIEGSIDETLARGVRRSVDYILDDDSFVAVVLRVDSPGGGVSPSDRIWREVERLRQSGRPVVASYGGIAASGGVFVSCGADEILCEPTATTGSVGVIASVLTFGELLGKLGIEPVTMVAAGSPRKDHANDAYRRWNDVDRKVLQGLLDRSYAIFIDRVMTGRSGKAPDAEVLRAALDGRILSAEEAIEAGLVDRIGYLDDAISASERLAGAPVQSTTVVRLVTPRSFWGNGLLGSAAVARFNSSMQDRRDEATSSSIPDLLRAILDGRRSEHSRAAQQSDGEWARDLFEALAQPRIEYRIW